MAINSLNNNDVGLHTSFYNYGTSLVLRPAISDHGPDPSFVCLRCDQSMLAFDSI